VGSFVWGVEQTCKFSFLPLWNSSKAVCVPVLELTGRLPCVDCTPYLLSLGLTKSTTSLVWVAGPLSGIIVQPIVGVVADESRSKWGRRRPFILVGAILSAICLLILGFTKEIVAFFISEPKAAQKFTMILAVVMIYAIDFAVNAGMRPALAIFSLSFRCLVPCMC
jgi:ABC-type Na+ efflux pump permease subunit